MQTLENGVEVFTNGDPYNLADDVAHSFDTANVVVLVADVAARDALAKYEGLTVRRMDIAGVPLQTWDGSAWFYGSSKRIYVNTVDATWAYNVALTRTLNDDGTQTVSAGLLVARISGGAFTVPTGSWTILFADLIPAGWRPTDNIITCGGFEFNGMGAVLLRFKTNGAVEASGVTGSVPMGAPVKVCASANWAVA